MVVETSNLFRLSFNAYKSCLAGLHGHQQQQKQQQKCLEKTIQVLSRMPILLVRGAPMLLQRGAPMGMYKLLELLILCKKSG